MGNISGLAVLAQHSLGSSHLKRFPALNNLSPEMQDMKCGPLCHARFVLFISWFKLILLVWLKVVDLCSATVLHVDKASWLGGKSTEDSPSSCEFLHHHVFQAVFWHQSAAPDCWCSVSHSDESEDLEDAAEDGSGCYHLLHQEKCLVCSPWMCHALSALKLESWRQEICSRTDRDS